jgi:4-amino-4-deoxy-L-arabinose transferase-like glycosyltransferase
VKRSAWLDPGSIRSAVALALLAAAGNAIWVLVDNSTPSWDQSSYMNVAIAFRDALQNGGPGDLLPAIRDTDPARGPLFSSAILPFLLIFGDAARSGMLVNIVLAPVLYLAAGQIAWIVFRSGVARLLAILFVATMPILVGLYHNILQDFLLVTVATVAVLLLLLSEGFNRRHYCVGLGVAMGLGTLTKVTFPAFMLGPVVVVLAQIAYSQLSARRQEEPRADLREAAINAGLAILVYAAIIAPWYVTNFQETVDYVRSTTSGPLSEGAGPEQPLTFHNIASFTTGMMNLSVSWVIGLAFLVALVLDFSSLRRLFRPAARVGPLFRLAFLAAWAIVPYLLIVTAHNQDVRLMAPAMPAMAVLTAGAVAAIPGRVARRALIGVASVILVYQTVAHVIRIDPSFIPDEPMVRIGDYSGVIQLTDRPIGYERLPESDLGTPVIRYIEDTAAAEAGRPPERTVCLLESQPIVNTNTFNFLAASRGDAYSMIDVLVGPEGRAGLAATLHICDFALYMRPPEPAPGRNERLEIVNEEYAARFMTPALFRIFRGPRHSFPASPAYLEERGPNVKVLSRNAAK